MRWWDIAPVLSLERELFTDDAWTEGLFWSELAQAESRHYLVASDAGNLIGYAGLAFMGTEAYVQTIGVNPEHWGIGLGSALLAALLAEAERQGAKTILLEVRADNERAARLYERFGFTSVGIRKGYYQPSGADAHVMIRGRV
jgi:ribosomal-protein-alanine N-acetyltransferase